LSFAVCTALNGSYQAFKYWQASKDLKDNSAWIESQLVRINEEIAQCPSNNPDRYQELDKMRRDLAKRLADANKKTVLSENKIGLGDVGEASAIEGFCGILRVLPPPFY
jgi:hypothetical protein